MWQLFVFLFFTGSITISFAAEAAFSSQSPAASKSRVVIVENSQATSSFLARDEHIPIMIQRGITALTGKTNTASAWRSLVKTNEIIGIKVYSAAGDQSGTRPAVVSAVIESLIEAGIAPQKIVLWDKSLTHLRLADFEEVAKRFGVRLESSSHAGYDEAVFYENSVLGEPVYGDLEFEKKGEGIGRKSYLSKLLTRDITKIINITPMLNHNHAGVTGNLYSLALGSVDNAIRFEHNADRLATAVPEIYGLTELADRVVLNITDALICQYQGEQRTLVHYSSALNQLRFSKDAVALDTLSIQELDRQRRLADKREFPAPNFELFKNASLLELGVSDTNRIAVQKIEIRSRN